MDKIYEDSELIAKRLSCGCLFPGHILDVSIELADEGKRVVEITLNLYISID